MGIVPMIALFCMLLVGCDALAIVVLQCIMQSFIAFQMAGGKSNMNDIAPQYASIMMGIANTVGSMPGFISPNLAGVFLKHYGVVDGWNYVFALAAVLVGAGGVFFGIFAQADLQEWAKEDEPEEMEALKGNKARQPSMNWS